MTYQVLARKWRPKDFASLVGQEHVVRALTHALDGGRLHHAYLFTGTRGVGKTTLSRIFAKALNCETGVTATPCGVCRACREIDEGRFVDYVEMDAASNRGVDEMAALLERAVYAPVDARFKVYMIDEVHMLTNHAFNAMLKTLEEPPAHVKFILATTDPQKIPVTVLSRCLQFNLKQMPAGHIVSHLERILGEEQITFEAQALRLLARAADGSMRDALSLTDQAIAYSANQVTEEAVRGMLGALDQSYLIRLLDALVSGDGAAVLAVADEMALRSLSFSTALQDLASLLHRIGWAQFAPSSVLDEWPEAADLRRFAELLSPEQVQLFYQIATIGRSELGLAPDEYAGFTMTLLRMLAFEPALGGGGGGTVPAARPAGQSGASGGKRTGAPAVTAQQAVSGAAPVKAALPAQGAASVPREAMSPVSPASDLAARAASAPAMPAMPTAVRAARAPELPADAQPLASAAGSEASAAAPSALQVKPAAATQPAANSESALTAQQAPTEQVSAARSAEVAKPASVAQPTFDGQTSAAQPTGVADAAVTAQPPMADATLRTDESAAAPATAASAQPEAALEAGQDVAPAIVVDVTATPDASQPADDNEVAATAAASPPHEAAASPDSFDDVAPANAASETAAAEPTQTRSPTSTVDANAAQPVSAAAQTSSASRRASGASAALDVLRNAGMKLSGGRAPAAASSAPAPAEARAKPAAPRVVVPTPDPARRAAQQAQAAPARPAGGRQGNAAAVPPWEEMPPDAAGGYDDYIPASADDAFFAPPDDGYMPVFDQGPDDVRIDTRTSGTRGAPQASVVPAADTRPLPPAIPLDALGFDGDWPALAAGLPLKGISYQLAFNSELMALDGATLKLNVPVPQYADAAQVAKLKAALAERLGKPVDVMVEVGPARRTAAALDAAERAQRQREAEREIGADPFVQSLIREFGASIVPGTVRPLAPSAQGGADAAGAAH
jgi:DNA polymerase-3 subunit gamma/tau